MLQDLQLELTVARCCAGHNYIGTEHILLGLLREGEGVAARVLETLGADPSKIRTQVCAVTGSIQRQLALPACFVPDDLPVLREPFPLLAICLPANGVDSAP